MSENTEMCVKLRTLACYDGSMITHSVMCGNGDVRLPKCGKLECRTEQDVEDLHRAIAYFFEERKPLTLAEIATPVFKYYQDVDVLLPHVKKLEEISEVESLWMECLIRCQAAVSAHESKAIRNANLAFVATKQCGPLHRLLANAFNGEDPTAGGTKNPWEDIWDKASAEGSSLRMPYTDKAMRSDKKNHPTDIMEGRPKLPVATYRVQVVGGDPGKCTLRPLCTAKDSTPLQWLQKGSVRLGGKPEIAPIWLPSCLMPEPRQVAVQQVNRRREEMGKRYTKTTFRGSGANRRTRPKAKPRDETSWIGDNLRGYWMDDQNNVLNVFVDQVIGQLKVFQGDTNRQIGVITPGDVNEYPIKLYFEEPNTRNTYWLDYYGDNDLQGTWKSTSQLQNWNWRRPAVFRRTDWPQWGHRVLLNVACSVDIPNSCLALAVCVHAVGKEVEAASVKQMYNGQFRMTKQDLKDGELTLPMGSLAAACLGLRICLDLGLGKKEIMLGCDHSLVEAQLNNSKKKVSPELHPLMKVLEELREEIQFPVRGLLVSPQENKATDMAKVCRQGNQTSTVGDKKLYSAIVDCIMSKSSPGGLNVLMQLSGAAGGGGGGDRYKKALPYDQGRVQFPQQGQQYGGDMQYPQQYQYNFEDNFQRRMPLQNGGKGDKGFAQYRY